MLQCSIFYSPNNKKTPGDVELLLHVTYVLTTSLILIPLFYIIVVCHLYYRCKMDNKLFNYGHAYTTVVRRIG